MRDTTQLLAAIEQGDPEAAEELLPLVYGELRRLAGYLMAGERPGQTLQATALVHEAWLRVEREGDRAYNDQRHFVCAAATAMRRILIDNARRKMAIKHGGEFQRVDDPEVDIACSLPDDQLLALDEALDLLEAENPRAAEVVKLRFFIGLTQAQVAAHQGVSVATVERIWAFARAWLFNEIGQEEKTASEVRETNPENRL